MTRAPGHVGEVRASIRPLSALVASQIAAGEVVERPASVVKELVENSLDAGATRISVSLEQGGVELVRVADDGAGIPRGELLLAIAPHATSKISQASDLDRVATLGFRGEALASICSVARVVLRSRTRDEPGAHEVGVEGDRVRGPAPAAGAPGTTIEVRNIFFNTPARRKFLRTNATEQARCLDVVRDLALAHPGVSFSASLDGRQVLEVPPGQSPRERALSILGEELAGELLGVGADAFDDARGITLWGLAGRPSIARPTPKHLHLFVNGRAVRDRTIQHAVVEAYRGLIEPGRYPTAVVMIEMSPAGVDVNVHPAKAEVRFRDSSLVHSVVLRALRETLRAADLTPTLTMLRPGGGWRGELPGAGGLEVDTPARAPMSPAAFAEFVERVRPKGEPLQVRELREALQDGEGASGDGADGRGEGVLAMPEPAPRVLQVHKSYLVTQDEQGMVIVDQHALHERVMFEYLVERILGRGGGLEVQSLLTPVVVEASPTQVDRLGELEPLLTRIGVQAEALGPASVGVRGFPTFLFDRGVDPAELMKDLFERSERSGFTPGSEEALRDVLDMMACKAAVKAGDRMTDPELRELVRLRLEVERSSNCPHGRPTSIRLTMRELDKLFGRG